MSRMLAAVVVIAASLTASTARAQISYKPVQYQYEAYGKTFYYGGGDARVLDFAARRAFIEKFVRYGRHPFGGVGYGDRARFTPQSSAYTDFFPPYIDAANYGFTADDARDEALRNRPRYFRKSDLLRSVEMERARMTVRPAERNTEAEGRGMIDIRPYTAKREPATKNARIEIIPKARGNVR